MFDQNIKRVGFACKIQTEPGKADPNLNTSTTTLSWLDRQTKDVAVERLWSILIKNTNAIYAQVKWLSKLPHHQRMMRITSDILPAYTHEHWTWFYFEPDVVRELEVRFAKIGQLAREHDVRLSFNPGQFCVLASENPQIVENSVYEFEYHCDIIRYMGFGKQFQDFKCNVHIGGKLGPDGIKRAMRMLSPEARNVLTIENAEFSWGLEHSLELVDTCALVLDIHHHWISTGEYIECNDDRVKRVIDSWRGVRPVIHYSLSREDILPEHSRHIRPDLNELLSNKFTKTKLRAHSDFYWNRASNLWAKSFMQDFDIMLESKEKNLARDQFLNEIAD